MLPVQYNIYILKLFLLFPRAYSPKQLQTQKPKLTLVALQRTAGVDSRRERSVLAGPGQHFGRMGVVPVRAAVHRVHAVVDRRRRGLYRVQDGGEGQAF